MDGVNTRVALSHYVTCSLTEGFAEGTGLHGSLCAITEILCQVHPCWAQVGLFLEFHTDTLSPGRKGSAEFT